MFAKYVIKADIADLAEIIDFEKEVLNRLECTSLRSLHRLLKSKTAEILLVKSENAICAYAIGRLRFFKRPSGYIYKIAVKESFRKIGLATLLLESLEGFFIKNAMAKSIVEVRESNIASIALFQKNGYNSINNGRPSLYFSSNDGWELEKGVKFSKVLNCKKSIKAE